MIGKEQETALFHCILNRVRQELCRFAFGNIHNADDSLRFCHVVRSLVKSLSVHGRKLPSWALEGVERSDATIAAGRDRLSAEVVSDGRRVQVIEVSGLALAMHATCAALELALAIARVGVPLSSSLNHVHTIPGSSHGQRNNPRHVSV